jgi:hypothetical protein
MSSGKAICALQQRFAIAAIAYLSARLRKMTNWLRKGSDTLEHSDQFKERCLSLDIYVCVNRYILGSRQTSTQRFRRSL